MKKRKKAKIAVDILMSILLLFLMAYQVTGELWHEWCGAAMLFLFLVHNFLNRKWYMGLFRGKYLPSRILMTVTNFLCLTAMLCLMVSGIMMSRHVFAWFPIKGGMSFARMLHMAASYQGFVYMSWHIGLHWRMVTVKTEKRFGINKAASIAMYILLAAVSAYGLYHFVQMKLWRYMFALDMFVFMDYERPAVLVLTDYLCMMIFWAALAYYIMRLIGSVKKMKIS